MDEYMRVIASFEGYCVVEHSNAIYELKNDFKISDDEYKELQEKIKFRETKARQLGISDITHILSKKEHLKDRKDLLDRIKAHLKEKIDSIQKAEKYEASFALGDQQLNLNNLSNPINIDGWSLSYDNLIGIGAEHLVFKSTKNSIFGKKQVIIKVQKLGPIENFIDYYYRYKDEISESKESQPLTQETKMAMENDLAEQMAKEKHKINKKVGRVSTIEERNVIIEEVVAGKDLTQIIDTSENHPKERFDLFIKIIIEVQKLHRKGITHNDINSGNIMVDGKKVRLIDFGSCSKSGHWTTKMTTSLTRTDAESFEHECINGKWVFYDNNPEYQGNYRKQEKHNPLEDFKKDFRGLETICEQLGFDHEEFARLVELESINHQTLLEILARELASEEIVVLRENNSNNTDLSELELKVETSGQINMSPDEFWKKLNDFRQKIKNKKNDPVYKKLTQLWKIYKEIIKSTKDRNIIKAEKISLTSIILVIFWIIFEVSAAIGNCAFAINRNTINVALHLTVTFILIFCLGGSLIYLNINYRNHKDRKPPAGVTRRRSSVCSPNKIELYESKP